MILHFCEWLASFSASSDLRGSVWVYPIVESIHVLTLTLFVGMSVLWDLRLMNVLFRATPVSQVQQRMMPWMMGGFAVMVLSGVALFFGDPVRFYLNIFFRIKVVMLMLAGLNAYYFHASASGRNLVQWDVAPRTPFGARLAGTLSLVLWAAIVTAGRMIAYNWFDN